LSVKTVWSLHIQPDQLTKTRYFGGWSNGRRGDYMLRCHELLKSSHPQPIWAATAERLSAKLFLAREPSLLAPKSAHRRADKAQRTIYACTSCASIDRNSFGLRERHHVMHYDEWWTPKNCSTVVRCRCWIRGG